MPSPQFIKAPNGDEMVLLSRDDYEALILAADPALEDDDDLALYDARKAELGAGGAILPPEISAYMLRGDTRLKAIRKWRGFTQVQLADFATSIGQGYLSDLETGRRKGSPETLSALAKALGVPLDWLV